MSRSPIGIVHVHSDYSHDGRDSLERLREFATERNIGFVGMTDHAEDLRPEDYPAYVNHCVAVSDDRVRIIPGLEFRFAGHPGLHLLALGLTRWIDPETPGQFIEQTRGAAGFTIVAHPVLPGYRIPAEVESGIDAIEVWNASYNTRYLPDPKAILLLQQVRAARPEVVGTAGLDQHDRRNDRETRVVLANREADNPIAELRAGRFVNRGRTMHFDAAVAWGPVRLGALLAARWGYDRLERVQEKAGRWLRQRRESA